MEVDEYAIMFHREEEHWWYVGLHELVLACIAKFRPKHAELTILDAGCGTGKMLELLRGYRTFGLEYSSTAFAFLKQRSLSNVVRADVCRVPFDNNRFDVVISLDVLCCVETPRDWNALRELARVLKPGGLLILNLPAYPKLHSRHDEAVHTKQRYTRRGVREMIQASGLQVRLLTYRNTILFPIAAGVRLAQKLLGRTNGKPESDLQPLPALVNRALTYPLRLEKTLLQAGLRLPFGLSVFAVAIKPEKAALLSA